MGHRGELDVIEIVAVAGDEARVFDPLDRRSEDVRGHLVSLGYALTGAPERIVSAAWRIAATMFW